MNSGVKPQKQIVFIAKSPKKPFLLTNSGVTSSILGVSGLKLHSSSTKPVNFLGAQSSLEVAQFSFGGTSSDLGGGTAPDCPPPVAPGLRRRLIKASSWEIPFVYCLQYLYWIYYSRSHLSLKRFF